MPSLLDQYLPLAVFMAVAAVISGALLVAPFLVAFKAPDPEKLSAYECGFNAFDDARMRFDVRFYLSTAEQKCARWRRESVPVRLREKGGDAPAICLSARIETRGVIQSLGLASPSRVVFGVAFVA